MMEKSVPTDTDSTKRKGRDDFMAENDKDSDFDQRCLTDFVNSQSSNDEQIKQKLKEQGRRRKRQLIEDARRHVQRFLELMLKASNKGSIDFIFVRANFNIVVAEMERQGKLFIKNTLNGRTKIFKHYRCESLESWKNCHRYPCFLSGAYRGFTTCPYADDGEEPAPSSQDNEHSESE